MSMAKKELSSMVESIAKEQGVDMSDKVKCCNCDWHGIDELQSYHKESDHLVLIKDKNGEYMRACPNCNTDHYLMDI